MKKVRKNKKGFTLVELIIVIAILAILAAVAIPSFMGLTQEAERGRDIGNASAVVAAVNAYNALYPNDKILGTATAQADLTAVSLWPEGMADADVADAMLRVDIDGTSGVATVNTAAVVAAAP